MQQFKTLMLREWMQHRKSWLILGLWTPVIAWALVYLLALYLGMPLLHEATNSNTADLAHTIINGMIGIIILISLIAILLTIPGMPYRDKDDKSLEFWRSLPVNERSAVLAPVLMNGILLPLLAIMAATTLNLLLSAPLWIASFTPQLGINLLLGYFGHGLHSLLILMWFLPLVLLLAVGNSLIRRWGMAFVLIGALALQPILIRLSNYAPASQFVDIYFSGLFGVTEQIFFLGFLTEKPEITHQFAQLIRFVADPAFAIAMIVSALCLAALIWRRKTGQTA